MSASTADQPDSSPFGTVLTDPSQLTGLYREVSSGAANKEVAEIDQVSADFIAAATFCLIGTSDSDGNCDVSPKGGNPGFVKVLDGQRLVIPDLNGNNRLDSIRNIIDNPHVGLLFLVPERGETLRVNGKAWVTVDDEILDLFTDEYRRPTSAIGVQLDTAYMHCAKCIRRAGLWEPDSWSASAAAPTGATMLFEHLGLDEKHRESVERNLERSYVDDLIADRPVTNDAES
ncbi:MAG: PPOX class probable FMN-dependent enzyme [Candidatus Poriferisodalaceae bacterium]|jgi:uncharacterized protein